MKWTKFKFNKVHLKFPIQGVKVKKFTTKTSFEWLYISFNFNKVISSFTLEKGSIADGSKGFTFLWFSSFPKEIKI